MRKVFWLFMTCEILSLNLEPVVAKDLTDFSATAVNYFTKLDEPVGAKASGMGRSFIAVANDPSTLYLNPAGLFQLKRKELYFCPPIVVFIWPWQIRLFKQVSTFAFGVGFQELVNYKYNNSYQESMQISNMAGAYSISIFPNFYCAFDYSVSLKMRRINYSLTPSAVNDYHSEDEIGEKGVGSNLGGPYPYGINASILYKPFSDVNLGFFYKNKTKIDWESYGPNHDGRYTSIISQLSKTPEPVPTISGTDILPSSFGFGLAVKLLDNLLVSADMVQNKWSEAKRVENNKEINPGFKDTTEIHIGGEYISNIMKKRIPFRFGLFTKPDYVPNSINEDQIFLTIGVGYQLGILDFSLSVEDSHLLSSGEKKETKRNVAVSYKFGKEIKDK